MVRGRECRGQGLRWRPGPAPSAWPGAQCGAISCRDCPPPPPCFSSGQQQATHSEAKGAGGCRDQAQRPELPTGHTALRWEVAGAQGHGKGPMQTWQQWLQRRLGALCHAGSLSPIQCLRAGPSSRLPASDTHKPALHRQAPVHARLAWSDHRRTHLGCVLRGSLGRHLLGVKGRD